MNEIVIKGGKIFIDDEEIKNLDSLSIYDSNDGGFRISVTFMSKGEGNAND
ncbi:hypothetical protein [Companilactobacillus farciminis]|uniref:hypothetical protein n=1 Tax=Companilactobacillus farciminis TaxID=1612 RepID=UPI00241D88E7|nr:hypothetical protein [Companilactobacillus farciminis]